LPPGESTICSAVYSSPLTDTVFLSSKDMECKIFLGDLYESIRRGVVMLVGYHTPSSLLVDY
jgi:hypothetical protein